MFTDFCIHEEQHFLEFAFPDYLQFETNLLTGLLMPKCNDRLMSFTFAVPKWWEMGFCFVHPELFRNQLADALNGVDEVGVVGKKRCLKTENPLLK